MVTEVVKS